MRLLTLVRVFPLLAMCPGFLAHPPGARSDLAARQDFEGSDSVSEDLVENPYELDGATNPESVEQEEEDNEVEDASDAVDGTTDPEVAEMGDDNDASESTAELGDGPKAVAETSGDLSEEIEASDNAKMPTADGFTNQAAWGEIPGGANCYTDADRALWKWRRRCESSYGWSDWHWGCTNYAPSRFRCCTKDGERKKRKWYQGFLSTCNHGEYWPRNDQERHMCGVNCDEGADEPWCKYGKDPSVNNPVKFCSCKYPHCRKDWSVIKPDPKAKCYRWNKVLYEPYFDPDCKMQEAAEAANKTKGV